MIVTLNKPPPPICARCARPAEGLVTLVTRRGDSRGAELASVVLVEGHYTKHSARVPFCLVCRQRYWTTRLVWSLGSTLVGLVAFALIVTGADGSMPVRIAVFVGAMIGLASPFLWFLSRDWGLGPVRLKGPGEVDVPAEVAAKWRGA